MITVLATLGLILSAIILESANTKPKVLLGGFFMAVNTFVLIYLWV